MKRAVLLTLFIAAAICFAVLGVWQLDRRAWKLDLIARVDARAKAMPVAAPVLLRSAAINARDHEYRRVWLSGRFVHSKVTLVDALTQHGSGFWVMTPLVTKNGTVLVNRGFVRDGRTTNFERPTGEVLVVGLLRMSEPGGRFMQSNQPSANLWYSRDLAAIAAARKIQAIAPFFVDAEAHSNQAYPIAGLTVVHFRNVHLSYAITWFALAGLAFFGVWRLFRDLR